ncbi:MAG: PAS domain S-box protein [Ignavibacteria bacterium]|nr:PAS domain S-box protein [Ignavibacteria bacterium]
MSVRAHSPEASQVPDLAPVFSLYPHRQNTSPQSRSSELFGDALLTVLWSTSTDGLVLSDENGILVAVNQAFCGIMEKRESDLIGKSFVTLWSDGADPARLVEAYRRRFKATKLSPMAKHRLRLWTGRTLDLEVSGSFVHLDDGLKFLLMIVRDVSAQRKAEREREESESRFRDSFDHAPVAYHEIDLQGRIVAVNQTELNMLGYAAEEMIGRHPWEFLVEKKVSQSAVQEKISGRVPLHPYERTFVRKDGTLLPLLITDVLLRNSNGDIIGIRSALQDFSERKEMELEIRRSEARYHSIFDNAVQGMFQTTMDGRFLAANAALLQMLGYESFEDLAKVNLSTLYVDPEDRAKLADLLRESGKCSNVELMLRRKDGRAITVLEHSRVILDDAGNVLMFEGILEDISARKALERKLQQYIDALRASEDSLKRLNAQKDKLFSILSHDLRSPFSSILGFCDILIDEGESLGADERTEYLNYIRLSAQQQLGLVNKLLDWSRFETNRINMDVKEVDLHDLAMGCLASLSGIALQKGINLESVVERDLITRGDENMLAQVMNNIVGNALKFTPTGGSVRIFSVQQRDNMWTIGVRDSGIGIPQADLHKIFKIEEKYTRKGTNGEPGTGLGLPVCLEIMQKHSGRIDVESEEGQGTTFLLSFPKYSCQEGPKILIVDDEQGVRALHSLYVRRAFRDVEVLHASDGKEALEMVENHRPLVVVSDYRMPSMDGFEFIRVLRETPGGDAVPVIFVTGEDSFASKEALRLAGATAVLTKPIVPADLTDIMKQNCTMLLTEAEVCHRV